LALRSCVGDRAESLLEWLSADRREAVEAELAKIEGDAATELATLRATQLEALEAKNAAHWGPLWRQLSPRLRACAWRETVSDGG
jgi:hypothetical protein